MFAETTLFLLFILILYIILIKIDSQNQQINEFETLFKTQQNLQTQKINELVQNHKIDPNYLNIYKPINVKDIDNTGTEVHYLGYYYKWDPQEMYYYSVENTGFRANDVRTQGSYSKYSGIDDKIDWLHYYMTVIKFGIGRATYDASQEIRNEKITREEGIALVNKYDNEFPEIYFDEILQYLNISENQFWEIVDSFRSPLFWKKNGDNWTRINMISS